VSAGRDHRSIRGSAALSTAPAFAEPELATAEALAPGEMRRIGFHGEWLGAVRVRARYAPLPLEAFDRVADVLEADEQGTYFQLLRLSYAEGRNFCRTPQKELQRRLKLSERRLHRVLDALVTRGFVRPLHRDNRGTLWRVYLPREAFGEPLGDDVLLGRPASAGSSPIDDPEPGRSGREPRGGEPGGSSVVVLSADRRVRHAVPMSDLARQLAEARGTPGQLAAAEEEIAELLADGASPRQIEACIAVARTPSRQGAAP